MPKQFISRPTRRAEWVTLAMASRLTSHSETEILSAIADHGIRTKKTSIGKMEFLLIDRTAILEHCSMSAVGQ